MFKRVWNWILSIGFNTDVNTDLIVAVVSRKPGRKDQISAPQQRYDILFSRLVRYRMASRRSLAFKFYACAVLRASLTFTPKCKMLKKLCNNSAKIKYVAFKLCVYFLKLLSWYIVEILCASCVRVCACVRLCITHLLFSCPRHSLRFLHNVKTLEEVSNKHQFFAREKKLKWNVR